VFNVGLIIVGVSLVFLVIGSLTVAAAFVQPRVTQTGRSTARHSRHSFIQRQRRRLAACH
jgi:hypothetical protein